MDTRRKCNNTKGGKYLKKFVANTEPKVTICLCGRGAHNTHHPGNRYIYEYIDIFLDLYQSLVNKEKEELTNEVVQEFESQGRRLFKLNDNGEWEELDLDSAKKRIRAKISQRFRDASSSSSRRKSFRP